ncbi:hypothetical protein V499_00822 [Pseudogymnoascus sp. VKM F-103]|nr:hypothetical protein V499_00822 [Pseudogymnoascus sp. VKM F-103]
MSSNHVTTQGHYSWTTSTQLSTESGERCQQKADAAKKGFGAHHGISSISNTPDMPLTRRSAARTRRSVSNLSAAQLDRKRKIDRENQRGLRQRTKDYIQQLELRVQELEYLLAENAADNNNVGSGMPMDLGQNMGADTANTKWPIDTDNNMVSAFGNETSTGDIYNVGEEGDYAFSSHIMQQPRESLASGNLYTTDVNNSFHEDLPKVGQPLKYRRLIPFSTKFQQ